MLMAAGLGTRLRPYSERIAKPLVPVCGVPCAQFTLDGLKRAGVEEVVINIHHLPEPTRAGIAQLHWGETQYQISDESRELLGSAGGLRHALPLLGNGPIFISNADVLCSLDWSALGRAHQRMREKWGVEVTLALMPIPKNAREAYRPIRVDALEERVTGLGEKGQDGLMYVGCAVLETAALARLSGDRPLEFVPEILQPAIQSGRAAAWIMPQDQRWIWLDVGSPALWWEAHMEILRRLELGDLPKHWRLRIEAISKRVAPYSWISRKVHGGVDLTESAGPLYWGLMDSAVQNLHGKHRLGPGTVLYGEPTPDLDRPGLSALGFWSPMPAS